jgi:N-dimethylarginine dimethylaminohydrolase
MAKARPLRVVEADRNTMSIVDKVTLELSEKEAQFLHDLMDFVGGNSSRTDRKYADTIRTALEGLGYVNAYDDFDNGLVTMAGVVYCSEKPMGRIQLTEGKSL